MIDREKVVKGLTYCSKSKKSIDTEVCPMDCPYYNHSDYCIERLIDDALALLKEQEWYLLTEDTYGIIHGLPGDDGQYLMTDGEEIWIDDYVDGVADGIFLDSGRDIREITAWMYMPKLPKKDRR